MASRPRRRFVLLAALAVAAVAAACLPVTPPPKQTPPNQAPPQPSIIPTSLPSNCSGQDTPTGDDPLEYAAVVDDPGPTPPEVVTFEASTAEERDAALADLADESELIAYDVNTPVTALVDPADDPGYGDQWGLPEVGFQHAWARGLDGTGVTIAVLDTGIDGGHPEFAGRLLPGWHFLSTGSGPGGTTDDHGNGHGTHVSGIAAAGDDTQYGLGGAPQAQILPIKVLNADGSGYSDDIAAGVNKAVALGADVINLSLGGSCNSTMGAAVLAAEQAGVVVVAAAGNGASNAPIYPAGFDNSVIAVGATTATHAKASFSNYGTPFVDIGAPGSGVWSTLPMTKGGFGALSGTSMATPFVTAAMALLHQELVRCGTNLSPDQIRARLHSTATYQVPYLGARLMRVNPFTGPFC